MANNGINITWNKAYLPSLNFTVVYNIYFSKNRGDVFKEGVKYVITNPNQTSVFIPNLELGTVYYVAVRASTMPVNTVNLSGLPQDDGLFMYPEGILLNNISDTDTVIPVMDADTFPNYGIVKIGSELIGYTSVDIENSSLISSLSLRGLFQTEARIHTIDGYDGFVFRDPIVRFFKGFEEQNTSVALIENRFEYPNYAFTEEDGYKSVDDIVHVTDENRDDDDNCSSECVKIELVGYRRTHPADLLAGKCVGSYYGGEHWCADSNGGVGRQIRGLSIEDFERSREETLLETTGEPMVLLRRQVSGITSKHYDNHRENTAYRGFDNHGTAFVQGYEQYFNTTRSDGRILVRFEPTQEDIERSEYGLENIFYVNGWTLPMPTIKDGDVLIRFNRDGTEEFRYEIINVTRNRFLLNTVGVQKFTAARIRKTDPIYQFLSIRDTSNFPMEIATSVASGPGIPPHSHSIVINEGITSISQINQTTSIAAGHSHRVVNGEIEEAINGHSHVIII